MAIQKETRFEVQGDGRRLDVQLAEASGLTRSRVAALMEQGLCLVDGRAEVKAGAKARPGQAVVLTVPADVTGLLSGMFADVTFHTDVAEQTIVVPTEAIRTSNGVQYVYVVEEDTARYIEVTTGLVGSGVTEVTSGLTEGQQLVTVGQAYLADGDPVRVVGQEG